MTTNLRAGRNPSSASRLPAASAAKRPAEIPASSSAPERPRERLLAHGPQVLTSAELLAIILRTGIKGCNAVALSHRLIQHCGSLRELLAAEAATLLALPGLGHAKACEILAISELSRRALEESLRNGETLDKPQRVKQYCAARLAHLEIEHCVALFLDNRLRLITCDEVSKGTLSQASVYPREIVKAALRHHAAAIILAHNHPSGLAEPSQSDIALTHHLRKALALVDIRLLDHLIVTRNVTVSLAEQGVL